jgi:hypothetical protein
MIRSSSNPKDMHIYYDISLYNDTNNPILAKLFENRNSALIKKADDYYLSIVRFLVDATYTPIFIYPNVANNQPDNNYYSVTIRRAGVSYQQFLTYVPMNNFTNTSPEYLFIYSYQQFIDMINTALRASFIAAGGSATTPPYLIYDAPTGIISMVAQYAYANLLGEYEIYFNNPLFIFFDNWKTKRYGVNQLNGKDDLIYIQNNGNNDYAGHPPSYADSATPDSYKMDQEYNSLYNWNSIRSIVFISNTLPVAGENINIQTTNTVTNGSVQRKILTDFEPNLQNNPATLRTPIQYAPNGQYRYIDLFSDQPLMMVDVQIFFETNEQVLYPLYLNPGAYISLKMLFENKKFRHVF